MIDFYNNLPKTKEDIEIYLRLWLQPIENGTKHAYKGNTWTRNMGFVDLFKYMACMLMKIRMNIRFM